MTSRRLRNPLSAVLVAGLAMLTGCQSAPLVVPSITPMSSDESEAAFWRANGQQRLAAALSNRPIESSARGIILFVGDGMGITTVTAGRWFDGEQRGVSSEANTLSFERFPWSGLVRTYNVDAQTPDSAGTMSAIITGVKTDAGILSQTAAVQRGDCASSQGQSVLTLLEQLEDAGWATGVVTTTRVTHATPGATYAHVPERGWEDDTSILPEQRGKGCRDIARQLLEFAHGNGIEVVMGGGRRHFLPKEVADPEYSQLTGRRSDGRDLTREWLAQPGSAYVWNQAQFDAIDVSNTRKLLGLFNPSHMHYALDRHRDKAGEPSLAQMVQKAIEMLQRDDQRFLLVVESGRIDHAHHATNAKRALQDTIALSDAVRVADELTGDDTLLIVTADHSHVLSIAGYSTRGNPVLGVVARAGRAVAAADKAPYTTLSYANGRGGRVLDQATNEIGDEQIYRNEILTGARRSPADVDTQADGYHQDAMVPLGGETHAGEDVAVYAKGPWAHLLSGTAEQSYIFYVMQHAAGVAAPATMQ
ncbi:MAG: alkaline phosphatase [Pseudomonadota bacterium]